MLWKGIFDSSISALGIPWVLFSVWIFCWRGEILRTNSGLQPARCRECRRIEEGPPGHSGRLICPEILLRVKRETSTYSGSHYCLGFPARAVGLCGVEGLLLINLDEKGISLLPWDSWILFQAFLRISSFSRKSIRQ